MPKRPKPAPSFTLRSGESISFVLPVKPRTKKNHGSVIKRGERKYHIPSEPYREMEADIVWAAMQSLSHHSLLHPVQLRTLLLDQPLNCAAIFHREKNIGDAVGYYQGLADALEAAGIVSDDKWITQWDGSRLAKDADRSRIEVMLTAI